MRTLSLALVMVFASGWALAGSVDLVVRDKHGRLVRDLTPTDLEIREDGTPVKIEALHLSTAGHPSETGAVHLVSVLFDCNSEDASSIVRETANEISKQLGPNLLISVWQVRDDLRLIQPFTSDEAALRKAFLLASSSKARAGVIPAPVASAANAKSAAGEQIPEMTLKIIAASQELMRERHARPLLAALLAFAREEKSYSGRKTVLYISDAIHISTLTPDQLRAVVGEANRSAVSFYTADISGVTDRARDEASQMMMDTLGMGAPSTSSALYQQASRAESMGLSNSREGFKRKQSAAQGTQMQDLANLTGGATTASSSALRKLVRNMLEDTSNYYEVTYPEHTGKYDGHFLALNVKVDRTQARVQSPSGYFALPPGDTSNIEAFELPLLHALDSGVPPEETIWFDSKAVQIPGTGGKNSTLLLIQVPLSGLMAREDDSNKVFRMHLSLAALVKDSSGKIVQKAGQDIGLQGAIEQLQQARKDVYTFERSLSLAPGDYRAAIAIEDNNAVKISSKTVTLSVPSPSRSLAVSDLIVVRRLEPLPAKADATEVLQYQTMRVVPDLGSRHTPVADPRHPVFFEILPDPAVNERPRAEAELRRGAAAVTRFSIPVPEGKPGEHIPVLAALNNSPPPGDYTLTLLVTQGSSSRKKEVTLTIPEEMGESDVAESVWSGEANPESEKHTSFNVAPKLLPNVQRPSDSEIEAILRGTRARVEDYKRTLPNFICMTVTRRFIDPTGRGAWKPTDSRVHMLRYVDGAEATVLLEVNGRRVTTTDDDADGAILKGEFGELLSMVISEKTNAQISWQGQADISGARTQVFRFEVSRAHSAYQVSTGVSGAGSTILAAYRAMVYIDAKTLGVKRIFIEAEDLPKDFHIRESAISVDYDYVPISGQEHLLPLSATLFVRQGAHYFRRNDIEFQNYRKYGAESTLKTSH